MESTTNSGDDSALLLLKEQEEKLKAKYGGMIPKKNLIVSDRKHFDSADWSRSKQQQQQQKQRKFGDADSSLFFEEDVGVLKPVLGAKDVQGTSPPSDASTFTTTNTQTKRRTSMDESRGKWDIHNNANNNTSANNNNKSNNNNNNSTHAVNSAYHAPPPGA